MDGARSLLVTANRVRSAFAFRRWALRTRMAMAGCGCDVEIVAPHGAEFFAAPAIEPTLQALDDVDAGRRGRLRIELGRHVNLGRSTVIEVLPSADSVLRLGDGVACGAGVRMILFGGEITVGAWSRLRDGVTLKSSGHLVTGQHLILQSWCMLHCANELRIGERVSFAERVTVIDSDHLPDGSEAYNQRAPLVTEPVTIGDNTWLGANAVVLRGARLGRNSVVAAGSLVRSGDHPEGWLIAGVPATARKPLAGGPAARN